MVRRWRSVIRAFSGVRRSAYRGKRSRTLASSRGKRPSETARPTSNDVTLFETDRTSCFSVGEKRVTADERVQRWSMPVK